MFWVRIQQQVSKHSTFKQTFKIKLTNDQITDLNLPRKMMWQIFTKTKTVLRRIMMDLCLLTMTDNSLNTFDCLGLKMAWARDWSQKKLNLWRFDEPVFQKTGTMSFFRLQFSQQYLPKFHKSQIQIFPKIGVRVRFTLKDKVNIA